MHPRRWLGFMALSAAPLAAAACGGNVVAEHLAGAGGSATSTTGTTSTTTTGTTTTTTTGTGGSPPAGDCATAADCGGAACIELAPGGWRTCAHPPAEAVACTSPAPPVPDQCCSSADCGGGRCYRSADLPYCGGAPRPEYNLCVTDQCASDADCVHDNPDPWICLPAGAFGAPGRTCGTGTCHTNADCTAQPGGACRPIANPCCSVPQGLACVYPGGCATDTDCAADGSQHCSIDVATGRAVCVPGMVGCPA